MNNASIVEENLAVGVHKATTGILVFPNLQILHDSLEKHQWILESKSGILLDTSTLGDADVTIVIFKEITSILPSRSNSSYASKSTLNGPIISVSISNNSSELASPIILTFEHGKTNMTNAVCSFWRFTSTDQLGSWASNGCKVRSSNETITVCECNHLTHFAVLMSPFVEEEANSAALRLLSIVAMSVSAFCLLLMIIVFAKLWRYVRSDKSVITLHLSAALIASYVIFIAGVDQTENKIVCTAVAASLHYIYLVVFCLMLAEGIRMAKDVVLVFDRKSRLLQILVSAWSVPAIIVGTTLAITKTNGYGNENYCWLTLLPGLRWAFVGPALFIILCNIIVLILLFKRMFALKAVNNKTIKEKIKMTLWSLSVLVPLMGISWIFGILYVSKELSFMQYLFSICNGLQGVLIFVFNCVLNGQVRDGLKKERIKYLNKSMTTSFSQGSLFIAKRAGVKPSISSNDQARVQITAPTISTEHDMCLQSFPEESAQKQKDGDPVKTETELSLHHMQQFQDELKKTIELFCNKCGDDLNELPAVNGNPNGNASGDGTGLIIHQPNTSIHRHQK
ncbi:adhesion G protein-coupled receptor B1-like [Dreissena polymorpha]|nr:adhesion G protein-coupled receptor B1-like [Dreissena polymorpha]